MLSQIRPIVEELSQAEPRQMSASMVESLARAQAAPSTATYPTTEFSPLSPRDKTIELPFPAPPTSPIPSSSRSLPISLQISVVGLLVIFAGFADLRGRSLGIELALVSLSAFFLLLIIRLRAGKTEFRVAGALPSEPESLYDATRIQPIPTLLVRPPEAIPTHAADATQVFNPNSFAAGLPDVHLTFISSTDSGLAGRTVRITKVPFTIGREGTDLAIKSDSGLSREHASIDYALGVFTIADFRIPTARS